MKRSSAAAAVNLNTPGPPNYHQKGWSSERVPPPAAAAASARSYVFPFNNGKALPSKWEDAEKWILSPGDNTGGRYSVPHSHHHHHQYHYRRPKSKSGPLGPPAYFSSSAAASPLNPCFDSGRVRGLHAGSSSPFLTGVIATDSVSCGSASSGVGGVGGGGGGRSSSANTEPYISVGGGGGGRSSSANTEPSIIRSTIIHGWLDTMMIGSSSSLPSSRDEKNDSIQETGNISSPRILRKDVATQMSPDGSPHSSPKEGPSSSPSPPSAHPIEELENHFSKLEVRDVQVDDRVTVTRWSKKHTARRSHRRSTNIIEWKKKTVEAKDSSSRWEVSETAKSISKYKREEAKITAWENLQKAKAEAAIRKLEMNLEKKRFSSMEKILKRLRSAQSKAKEMRSAVTTNQAEQVVGVNKSSYYFFRKTRQISALSECFMCHAS